MNNFECLYLDRVHCLVIVYWDHRLLGSSFISIIVYQNHLLFIAVYSSFIVRHQFWHGRCLSANEKESILKVLSCVQFYHETYCSRDYRPFKFEGVFFKNFIGEIHWRSTDSTAESSTDSNRVIASHPRSLKCAFHFISKLYDLFHLVAHAQDIEHPPPSTIRSNACCMENWLFSVCLMHFFCNVM